MNSITDLFSNALALQSQGRLHDAEMAYRQILRKDPDHPAALGNLASVMSDLRRFDEAIHLNLRAITIAPHLWQAHNNLANAYRHTHKLGLALDAYRASLDLNPANADTWSNYATSLKDIARLDDSIAAYRRALEINPLHAPAHSNLLFCLLYHPASTAESILAEARAWAARFAPPPPPTLIRPHRNDRDPYRRLRIGYVGADFYLHAQSYFTLPLFEAHDKTKYELHVFATQAREDDITTRIKASIKRWHDVTPLNDPQLAQLIRSLHIDLLVDLTMHMSGSRLGAFALSPAPIQLTYLAYPGTTGLTSIHHRLSDPHLDPTPPPTPPPHTPPPFSPYTENTLRLPHTFWCYNPLLSSPLPLPHPPSPPAPFTFASLNNFCKTNPDVLDAYARILSRVPDSRLLLLTPDGPHRAGLLSPFTSAGVTPDRVELITPLPRDQYLALFRRAHLTLDTWPYNGHTTSLDSLAMGTPVLTRVGHTIVGRAGLSQLTNLGPPFDRLITHSTEEFIRRAVELASSPSAELDRLRSLLPDAFYSSPLTNAPLFARSLEHVYRQLWLDWCQT